MYILMCTLNNHVGAIEHNMEKNKNIKNWD